MSIFSCFNKEQKLYFGDGFLYHTDKPTRITIPEKNLSNHFWCFGSAQAGKTSMLENMVEEDIYKGNNVIILDLYGNIDLFEKTSQVSLEAGRITDLITTSFDNDSTRRVEKPNLSYAIAMQKLAIKRIKDGDGVILFYKFKHFSNEIGKVDFVGASAIFSLFSALYELIEDKNSCRKTVNPPLCLYIDEAHSILYRGIDDLFWKSKSVDLRIHCFSKSINQIHNVLKDNDAAYLILNSIETKVFMRAEDEETAQYAAHYFPRTSKFFDRGVIAFNKLFTLTPGQFFMNTCGKCYYGTTRRVSKLLGKKR